VSTSTHWLPQRFVSGAHEHVPLMHDIEAPQTVMHAPQNAGSESRSTH
jgi:hypothetical protein